MRIGLVGGALQGTEAAYLCLKAGFETVLMDKRRKPPASRLVDEFHELNVVREKEKVKAIFRTVDAVLPTNENKDALIYTEKICEELNVPFMQDNKAFWITSDKMKSYKLLKKLNVPFPRPWPQCGFPVIVKPRFGSGSENVHRANNPSQLSKIIKDAELNPRELIIQEYVEGPALSLEVISDRDRFKPLQVTSLEFDELYGCKRVKAPVKISRDSKDLFEEIGCRIAEGLELYGLTDVQVLLGKETLKVNEINARLPSQTPTVVYFSSGINMVKALVDLFLNDKISSFKVKPHYAVIYQHIKVSGETLKVQGEHVMVETTCLKVEKGFFGCHEAITDLVEGINDRNWAATLIVKAKNALEAEMKLKSVIERIMDYFQLKKFIDPNPSI